MNNIVHSIKEPFMTLDKLFVELKKQEYIFVQTHNYPDHDAVASAFAFQQLLKNKGIQSKLIYDGDMQRDSLVQMISDLAIEIKHCSAYDMNAEHKIIIVDGCKGNKNVTDLIGDEIGVIDHHQVDKPEHVLFTDIRSGYGACSTIMYSYFAEYDIDIPQDVATALMIGINMDTALLTRGVGKEDIEAYANLYSVSDIRLQNSILRNYIQTKDLSFYRYAIDHVNIADELAFCYFPDGCNQNLLAILGDFFLSLNEVEFVILCAKNGTKINFSIRNEKKQWNAAILIQKALQGIGFGGGHADMAGGIMNNVEGFDPESFLRKFRSLLHC